MKFNRITNIILILLLTAAVSCGRPLRQAYDTLPPQRDNKVKIILHRGKSKLPYSYYQKWYLTKYLIELKGEEWYRDSVIKPYINGRSKIGGIVKLNRDGTFNIIRNKAGSKTLKELCDYLETNHKPLIFDYTGSPCIDFLPPRDINPDTTDCEALKALIRYENALTFVANHYNKALYISYPITALTFNGALIQFRDVKDADKILRLVKNEISQHVDSFEAETLRQNACPELTNEDFIGIPTREEFINAHKKWYYHNKDSACDIESIYHKELRYIDKFYKNKARRK